MTSFALEPIYGSLLFALFVAAATVAIILLVTPPTENVRQRRWLVALRLLAALILLLSIVRPALLRTDNRPADATLIVAVDTSRSMTLPDGAGGERWTTQVNAWKQLAVEVFGLESLELRLLAYDATARKLDATLEALDNQTATGELTDLSAAALAAIGAAEGQPIAGVVLMGDGTNTAPLKGTGAQRVIETLNSLGVPLWTVPIGPAGGQSASRDVAIEALNEHYQLFAGNEVNIDFQMLARGLAGIGIPVRLTWIDQDGKTTEVATRNITPVGASEVSPVSLSVRAPAPGTYRLQVEADQQDGELVTTNNIQTAFVDVREGGGRILYLEGAARVEQSFLRRSLRRFQDLDVTYQWIPADTSPNWPVDFGDWFQPGKFDVYIIGDLDSRALGDDQLGKLADTISQGAGLIVLGGNQSFEAGGYATSPLADVIPVRMDPASRREEAKYQLSGPLEVRLARNHPITDLGGEEPAKVWNQLPAMLGANRFSGAKVAPGVVTLLESPDQHPLLVIGEFGRGRAAALAIDSTWRWWRAGKQDAHQRFWRQLVLWLLAREETSGDKIMIEMDARRFALSNPPQFRASVQSLDEAAAKPELVAEVVDANDRAIPVNVSSVERNQPTSTGANLMIQGELPKLSPGFYRLRVRPKLPTDSLPAEEMAFQTIDESRELARPMADPVYLRQLAEITSGHGGAAFNPDEITKLIDTIKQRRRQAETPIVAKYRLGDGPISGWILFTLFTAALSGEWFLRRQWGLA